MIELVWDAGRLGTATAPSGMSVTVGEQAHFSPDDLLAMAAAGCLMRTFLRLAENAHLTVLSYAANARAEPACQSGADPHVTVHAYVVAPSRADEAALAKLCDESARNSPIVKLLGDRVTVTSEVRVLCETEATGG